MNSKNNPVAGQGLIATCQRFAFTTVVAGTLLVSQLPAISQATADGTKTYIGVPATKVQRPASPQDMLLVVLKDGADRQKFDDLLQEVHGTYVRTINCGPNLKFLVIQADSGKAAEVQKKLSSNNDIKLVQRNQTYRIHDNVTPQGNGFQIFENKLAQHHHNFVEKPHHHNFLPPFHEHNFLPGHGGGNPGHGHNPGNPGHGHNPGNPGHGHNPGNPGNPGGPPTGTANDPYLTSQTDYPQMFVTQARDSGDAPTSNVANLIILDTGYQPNADSPVAIQQFDFSDPSNPTGAAEPVHDSGSHGTEVGTVAAWTDNGQGFAGYANLEGQRVSLTVCRISNDGQSSDDVRIISALSFIASTPSIPTSIVNLSFGSAPPNSVNNDPGIQAAGQELEQTRKDRLVLASGNDGLVDNSPEQFCRRVAACDQNGNIASFSDTGPFKGCAPGVHVAVYVAGKGLQGFLGDGTSFAAPRWCACVLDVMAATGLDAITADSIVEQTGTPIAGGFVIPNFKAALDKATGH